MALKPSRSSRRPTHALAHVGNPVGSPLSSKETYNELVEVLAQHVATDQIITLWPQFPSLDLHHRIT